MLLYDSMLCSSWLKRVLIDLQIGKRETKYLSKYNYGHLSTLLTTIAGLASYRQLY